MHLTPRAKDKLTIALAAVVARRRLERGVKLNHRGAVAPISDSSRRGDGKTVAELRQTGAHVIARHQVIDGIAEMMREIQVEAVFADGTKLVTVQSQNLSRKWLDVRGGPPGHSRWRRIGWECCGHLCDKQHENDRKRILDKIDQRTRPYPLRDPSLPSPASGEGAAKRGGSHKDRAT
jgi:urease subunit gamma